MKDFNFLDSEEVLGLVFKYLTDLSTLQDFDEILIKLADLGRALTYSHRATVWVVHANRETIWTKVAHGIDHIELPIDSGLVGYAMKHKKQLLVDDVYRDPRFNQEVDRVTGYKTKSMLVIPMYDHVGEVIGAFQVMNNMRTDQRYSQKDLDHLLLAATYATETLITKQLATEIEETQREVVFTMGAIGESRSQETGYHVKRVAEYSKVLALAYGLCEDEAELLKQASPMHDIGKIAIPDSILNKPGRFNDDERKIMNTHAELGYNMIKNSQRDLLKAAAIVAYEHHEKWDGTGYPRGLSGENIHIYGRITAIADVFDALGSDRVYKKAWKDEKILKLFHQEKGKHFDPKLVELFFENLNEFYSIREKFKDHYEPKEVKEAKRSVKVLGAYGTKAKNYGTTSFLLNDNHVIDAGNLLSALEEKSVQITHVWLTHAHLDHISDIAYILDNYFSLRKHTLHIMGLESTIKALQEHYLNDIIWPDFSKIYLYDSDVVAVEYTIIDLEKSYQIGKDEYILAYSTDHTVESCGYIYTQDDKALLISADTFSLTSTLEMLEKNQNISAMVLECSFPSSLEDLAKTTKHLTPKTLFSGLENMPREDIALYINHIKPIYENKVISEVNEKSGKIGAKIVKDGEILHF